MKINQYISIKERKLLLLFMLLTFSLSITSYVSSKIIEYNSAIEQRQIDLEDDANLKEKPQFTFYRIYDERPDYRMFLIFLTFAALICYYWKNKLLISIFLTLFSQLLITYWILQWHYRINSLRPDLEGIPHLLKIASYFDYLFFTSVLILLLWQISILFRMLFRTKQESSILP